MSNFLFRFVCFIFVLNLHQELHFRVLFFHIFFMFLSIRRFIVPSRFRAFQSLLCCQIYSQNEEESRLNSPSRVISSARMRWMQPWYSAWCLSSKARFLNRLPSPAIDRYPRLAKITMDRAFLEALCAADPPPARAGERTLSLSGSATRSWPPWWDACEAFFSCPLPIPCKQCLSDVGCVPPVRRDRGLCLSSGSRKFYDFFCGLSEKAIFSNALGAIIYLPPCNLIAIFLCAGPDACSGAAPHLYLWRAAGRRQV